MGRTEEKKARRMIELSRQRSNVYGLLARMYRSEVTPDFLPRVRDPQFLGVLRGLGASIGEEFFQRPEEEVLEDLAVEYTRLFLGPGRHIPPYESVHHERNDGDWGRLWGADTVAVKAFIEAAGLAYQDSIEQRAWELAGCTGAAPAMRVDDFVAQRAPTGELPRTSYPMGVVPIDLRDVLR